MPPVGAAGRLLALCSLAALAAFATPSVSGATNLPGGTSSATAGPTDDSGTGSATVHWAASCPSPVGSTSHFWYVEIHAYHQDGSDAGYRSTAESNVASDARTQGLLLQMAPGLTTEAFDVTVTLKCYPYADTLIGDHAVTLVRGSAGGDGGGGGGGGGSGGGATGDGADDPLRPDGCAVELRGTAGADDLDGGPDGDLIVGLGGADRMRGRAGDDCLVGDDGSDRLAGNGGWDRLTGGAGSDQISGGTGRNAYDAGPGDDRIQARNGRGEDVDCGPGDDRVRADTNDRLRHCEHVAGRAVPSGERTGRLALRTRERHP